MILLDVLQAISGNKGVNITLIDNEGTVLITFNAAGYKAVEEDICNRKVKRIKIESATDLTIYIEDEDTP